MIENKNFPKSMWFSKSIPKREFVVIHAHLKKQEKSQINNLIYHLKELEKAKWKDSGNNPK